MQGTPVPTCRTDAPSHYQVMFDENPHRRAWRPTERSALITLPNFAPMARSMRTPYGLLRKIACKWTT
jgi:hypothetical protein